MALTIILQSDGIMDNALQEDALQVAIDEVVNSGVDLVVVEAANPHEYPTYSRLFWYCEEEDQYLDSDMTTVPAYLALWFDPTNMEHF